jgi:hypothetical protein
MAIVLRGMDAAETNASISSGLSGCPSRFLRMVSTARINRLRPSLAAASTMLKVIHL